MNYKRELEEIIATLLDCGNNGIEVFYKTPHSDPIVIVRCGKSYKKFRVRVEEV